LLVVELVAEETCENVRLFSGMDSNFNAGDTNNVLLPCVVGMGLLATPALGATACGNGETAKATSSPPLGFEGDGGTGKNDFPSLRRPE